MDIQKEPSPSQSEDTSIDIDALVEEVRDRIRAPLVAQCGTMQVLDMIQPIGLNDIYVSVNILETITGRRRLDIADLLQGCTPENFRRCGLGRITEERVPGLRAVENHSKLIVLGKPGSGKTTFLKYLAIQCSLGEFQANRVAIFISLRDFAEAEDRPGILVYIVQKFHSNGVTDTQTHKLLQHGRVMILLDSLDEVKEEDSRRILKQIKDFSENFPANHVVITCRIAGREYTFKQFTEVEVADFDEQQIASFVTRWFAATDPVKGKNFIQKLQKNESIQELANNPLLLTLLCLVFEESVDFPTSLPELYKLGLDLLLKKWDINKNIERSHVYKKLSNQQKEDLLSQIAQTTFAEGDYFFKHDKLAQIVARYIQHLPDSSTDAESLQIDSNAVIKSIEMQHGLLVERARGIYSFSHLTFQEYFTAREIVISGDPQALETALKQLASRITEKRWREVFLLTVGMLRNANYTLQLMKHQTDQLLAPNPHLQAFLTWAQQKSCTVDAPYKPAVVRAFYLALARTLVLVSSKLDLDRVFTLAGDTLEIAFTLDPTFSLNRNSALDFSLDRALALALTRALAIIRVRTVDFGLARALTHALERIECSAFQEIVKHSPLGEVLLHLKEELPELNEDKERVELWWQANGQNWTEQLRAAMISYRNLGHDWQFSNHEREALRQYYDANRLLLDCLNSNCYVTRAVREQLEEALLLPITEGKQR